MELSPDCIVTQLECLNQSVLVLIDWKHWLICSQLEIKADGLDLVSGDTYHQILVGNSALQKMKVETARWILLACHLVGMFVFSHKSLLALLFGAESLRRKPGPHFMLNNLSGIRSLILHLLLCPSKSHSKHPSLSIRGRLCWHNPQDFKNQNPVWPWKI